MRSFVTTPIGRLRLITFLEGVSLLLLIFVAVPIKYYGDDPSWVKAIGPVHGALFVLFVFVALRFAVEESWSLWETVSRVFLASFVPFGTFVVDHQVLRPAYERAVGKSS
jgi:integral membrane protein